MNRKEPRLAKCRPPIDGKEIKIHSLAELLYPQAESTEEKRQRIRGETLGKIKNILEENAENPFTLDDLAGKLYLHPRQVQRIFHSAKSKGFSEEMRRVRLKRSRRLLLYLSVSETSKRVQYKHPSHFGKAFKKEYGITPKAWKSREKERQAVR
jgi:AraC-like DNA-binding protein